MGLGLQEFRMLKIENATVQGVVEPIAVSGHGGRLQVVRQPLLQSGGWVEFVGDENELSRVGFGYNWVVVKSKVGASGIGGKVRCILGKWEYRA
jgi:hypothetical protein